MQRIFNLSTRRLDERFKSTEGGGIFLKLHSRSIPMESEPFATGEGFTMFLFMIPFHGISCLLVCLQNDKVSLGLHMPFMV
jgi:hypothetical protein